MWQLLGMLANKLRRITSFICSCIRFFWTLLSIRSVDRINSFVNQKTRKPLRSRVLVAACLGLLVACSNQVSEDFEGAYIFEGAQGIKNQGQVRYKIVWEKVPINDPVTYEIFERDREGGAFDFSLPSVSLVDETEFTTQSLIFDPQKCFIVRWKSAAKNVDTNTKEVCSDQSRFQFAGPSAIESSDEKLGYFYRLIWAEVPVANAVFQIHRRLASEANYDLANPIAEVKGGTSYLTEDLTFTQSMCYKVAFKDGDSKPLLGSSEVCSGHEPYVFPGVNPVEVTTEGKFLVSFDKAPINDASYLIFEREQTGVYDFEKPLATTPNYSFETRQYAIEALPCFVVRYTAPGAPKDVNTIEQCAPIGGVRDFEGIQTVRSIVRGIVEVTFTRSANEQVQGYRVYQGKDFNQVIATADADLSSMTIAGFAPGVKLTLGVRAIDAYGREDKNVNTMTVTVSDQEFAKGDFEGCVSGAPLDNKRVEITIAHPANTQSMAIYRNGIHVGSLFPPTVSFIDQDLREGETYEYRCRALIAGLAYEGSKVLNVATVNANPPTFTGIATATANPNGTVDLTWPTPDDQGVAAQTFKVYLAKGQYVDSNSDGNYENVPDWETDPLLTVAGSTYATQIPGLGDELIYSFRVEACSGSGVCTDGSAATCNRSLTFCNASKSVTIPDTGAPTSIGVVGATMQNGKAILTVPWDDRKGAVKQRRIFRSLVGGSDFANYAIYQTETGFAENAPPTTIEVTGLSGATSYFFIVRDVDAQNNSNTNTNFVEVNSGDLTPPAFAGLVNVSAGAAPESSVLLQWSAIASQPGDPNGASHYVIYQTSVAGTSTPASACSSSTAQEVTAIDASTFAISQSVQYEVTGLTPRTTYNFCVKARDAATNISPTTQDESITTKDFAAPTFEGLQTLSFDESSRQVVASWNLPQLSGGFTEAFTPLQLRLWLASDRAGTEQVKLIADTTLTSFSFDTTYFPLVSGDTLVAVLDACDDAQTGGDNYNASDNCTDTETMATRSVAIPDIDPPAGFAGITGATLPSPLQGGAVEVSWAAPADWTDYSGFRVSYLDGSNNLVLAKDCHCSASNCPDQITSCLVENLTPRRTYKFFVQAYDDAVNLTSDANPQLSAITVQTADTTAPAFVSNIEVEWKDTLPTRGASLVWNQAVDDQYAPEASPPFTYNVYRKASSSFSAASIAAGNPDGTLFYSSNANAMIDAESNLTPGTVYFYTSCAINAAGLTTCDGNVAQITAIDTTPPSGFSGIATATDTSPRAEGGAEISWVAPASWVDFHGFSIYHFPVGSTVEGDLELLGSCDCDSADCSDNKTSCDITGLDPARTYRFYVRAYDQSDNLSEVGGINPLSNLVTHKVADTTAPTFASGLNLVWENTASGGVRITFNQGVDNQFASENDIQYEIYRKTSAFVFTGGEPDGTLITTTESLTFLDPASGLTELQNYTYTICAVDEDPVSPNKTCDQLQRTIQAKDKTPPTISSLASSTSPIVYGNDTVNLTWTLADNLAPKANLTVKVLRKAPAANATDFPLFTDTPVATATGLESQIVDTIDVDTESFVTYRIIATDPDGNEASETLAVYADRKRPEVISITRVDANPIAGSSVNYLVTFSESVTSVSTANFSVADVINSGISANVASVAGTGASRTVTLDTFLSAGEMRLDLTNLTGVVDQYANTMDTTFLTGETYSLPGVYQEAFIKFPNPRSNKNATGRRVIELFGSRMAAGTKADGTSGTTILPGPTFPVDSDTKSASGAAYIFRRDGVNWTTEAYIKASNGLAGDEFGQSVALSGDTLAVGAPKSDFDAVGITTGDSNPSSTSAGTADSGAVYIYRKSATNIWTQEAFIKPDVVEQDDKFGHLVAIEGNTLVVSMHDEDSNQTTITRNASTDNSAYGSGALVVFSRTSNGWEQDAFIKHSTAVNNGWLGIDALDISGDRIASSLPGEDSNQETITNGPGSSADTSAANSGAVVVYKRTGRFWAQEAYFKPKHVDAADKYGRSVALDGDTLAVATYDHSEQTTITNGTTASADNTGNDNGAVYVYKHNGSIWQQEAYIKSPIARHNQKFGDHVSLAGNQLLVGTNELDRGKAGVIVNGTGYGGVEEVIGGAAFLFERNGGSWAQMAYITPPSSEPFDRFGGNVSIDGDSIAVASVGEDGDQKSITNGPTPPASNNNLANSGAIYVYRIAGRLVDVAGLIATSTSDTEIELSWKNLTSLGVGAKVVYTAGSVAPATCNSGTVAYDGTDENVTLDSLAPNSSYSIRICAKDASGNLSEGRVMTIETQDTTPPTVTSITRVDPSPTQATTLAYQIVFSEDVVGVSESAFSLNTIDGTAFTAGMALTGSGDTYTMTLSSVDGIGRFKLDLSNTAGISDFSFNDLAVAFTAGEEYVKNGFYQEAMIKAPVVNAGDRFGQSVAIDKNTMVVGAFYEDSTSTVVLNDGTASTNTSGNNVGAAYVYERTGDSWAFKSYLKAPNAGVLDFFGEYVAISGDRIAISGRGEDSNYTAVTNAAGIPANDSSLNSGAVYIYEKSGTNWVFSDYIKHSMLNSDAKFGARLSLLGNSLIVGASGADESGAGVIYASEYQPDTSLTNSGAFYLLSKQSGTWEEVVTLKASNSFAFQLFNGEVAQSNNLIAIGFQDESSNQDSITNGEGSSIDTSEASSGAVYVYRKNGNRYAQIAYIKASNSEANDLFGSSVDIEGDTLVVGAMGESSSQTSITNGSGSSADNSIADKGAVYVYRVDDSYQWTQESYIKNSAPQAGSFGKVALSGNTLVVGKPLGQEPGLTVLNGSGFDSGAAVSSTGTAFVFRRTGTTWSQVATLKPHIGQSGIYFGDSVDISGDTIAIAAHHEQSDNQGIFAGTTAVANTNAGTSGAVFIYRDKFSLYDPPSLSVVSSSENSIDLNWSNQLGIGTSVKIVYNTGTTPPVSCSVGTVAYEGSTESATVTSLSPAQPYAFRVCSVDAEGNFSEGIVVRTQTQDNTPPTVTSIARVDPTPTNAVSVDYTVTFSEDVFDLDASDFTVVDLDNTGITGSISVGAGTSSYTVTVGSITGAGRFRLDLTSPGSVRDNYGNVVASSYESGEVYSVSGYYQEAFIKASNNVAGLQLGFGNATKQKPFYTDGTRIYAGAFQESGAGQAITNGAAAPVASGALNSGAVYVFKKDASLGWVEEAHIKSSNSDTEDYFGYSVAALGNTLVAGAPKEQSNQATITNNSTLASSDNSYNRPGAAYVFKRTGSNWSQSAYLKAANISNNILWFGTSIAADQSRIAVGAQYENTNRNTISNFADPSYDSGSVDSGAVYVYKEQDGVWTQEAYIKASNAASSYLFGQSLSLSGDTLVVSQLDDSESTAIINGNSSDNGTNGNDNGSVLVYRRVEGQWIQEAYIKPPDSDDKDRFGNQLQIDGDHLAVSTEEDSNATGIINGSGFSTDDSTTNSGAVYVYKRTGSTWAQDAYIKPLENELQIKFGRGLALDGNTLAVGTSSRDTSTTIVNAPHYPTTVSGTNNGSVLVYQNILGNWQQIAYLKPPVTDNGDFFGDSVSVAGDMIAVSAYGESSDITGIANGPTASTNNDAAASGAIYVFRNKGRLFDPPVMSVVSNNAASISIEWGMNIGTGVGVELRYAAGSTPPIDCDSGTVAYSGANSSTVVTGLVEGAEYAFRICSFDVSNTKSEGRIFRSWVKDVSPPTVVSLNRKDSSPTSSTSLQYDLIFSEPIAGLTTGSFVFEDIRATGMTGTISGISGSGTTYVVTVSSIAGAGEFRIDLQAAGIKDYAGNQLLSEYELGQSYIVKGYYQQAYIKPSNTQAGMQFGYSLNGRSLAISGERIVVGANLEQSASSGITQGSAAPTATGSTETGAAYLYRFDNGNWVEEAYFKSPFPVDNENFGYSVDIEGTTMVIGAPGNNHLSPTLNDTTNLTGNTGGSDTGAVYVYSLVSGTWQHTAYLKASNLSDTDEFGASVALSGDRIVVGAPFEDTNASAIINGSTSLTDNTLGNSGAAYVFVNRNGSWEQEAYIKAANSAGLYAFGSTTVIDGDTLAVYQMDASNSTTIINGTGVDSDTSTTNAGSVLVYRRVDGAWVQEAYIKAQDVDASDFFGKKMAISGDYLAIPLSEDSGGSGITNGTSAATDEGGPNTSAVYVFKRSGSTWVQDAFIKAPEPGNSDFFNTVSLDDNRLAVSAEYEDSVTQPIINGVGGSTDNTLANAGAAYVYERGGSGWSQVAFVKAANADSQDKFGHEVAIEGDLLVVSAGEEDSNEVGITNGIGASSNNDSADSGAVYVYRDIGSLFSPSLGNVVSSTNSSITLNWANNVGSGESFVVRYQAGVNPPVDCDSGTLAYSGIDTTTTISGLGEGQTYTFRICAVDASGIKSAGTVVKSTVLDTTLPTLASMLRGGSSPTTGTSVTYDLVFSEPIAGLATTNFSFQDVNGSGITGNIASVSGSGTNYTVTADSLDGAGEFRLVFAPTGVRDYYGNSLQAGLSTAETYVKSGYYQEAYIKVSNNEAGLVLGDCCSHRMDADGTRLYLGVPKEDSSTSTIVNAGVVPVSDGADDSGAVFVFRNDNGSWVEESYIKPTNTGAGDQFGNSIAVSGNYLLVGAPQEDSSAIGVTLGTSLPTDNINGTSGASYLFERSGDNWIQTAYIKRPTNSSTTQFGFSVDIDETVMAIGASTERSDFNTISNLPNDTSANTNGTSVGAVFVYEKLSGNWTQTAFIKAANATDTYNFGYTVKVEGDTLAVHQTDSSDYAAIINGSGTDTDSSLVNAGSVYIYRKVNGLWQQEAYIKPSYPIAGGYFGRHIDLSGDRLVASSPFEDSNATGITNGSSSSADTSFNGAGAAFVYKRTGSSWAQEAYIKSLVNSSQNFGRSVSLHGNTLAIGARELDSNVTGITNNAYWPANGGITSSGGVAVYSFESGAWQQKSFLRPEISQNGDLFGSNVLLAGDRIFVAATGDDSNQASITNGIGYSMDDSATDSGAIYVYRDIGNLFDPKLISAVSPDTSSIDVSWSENTGRGVAYELRYALGVTAPTDCDSGLVGYAGPNATATVTSLTEGAAYSFRLCSVDASAAKSRGIVFRRSVMDSTVPTIVSITRADPSPTSASSVDFTLTMSEKVTGLQVSAFTIEDLGNTGISGTVSSITGTGPVYTVTVSPISGAGEFRLDLTDTTGIRDVNLNGLASTFTTGETYVKEGWYQEAYIKPSNAIAGMQFGFGYESVALDDDTLAVGLQTDSTDGNTIINGTGSLNNTNATNSGAVFVYKRTGDLWAQEAYIKAVNSDAGDFFGGNLDLDKDTLVVAALEEDGGVTGVSNGSSASATDTVTGAGAVYVYKRSGNTWIQEAYLKPSVVQALDRHGRSVSVSGNLIAVGTNNDDSATTEIVYGTDIPTDDSIVNPGAVFVYSRTGNLWKQAAYIKAANTGDSDNFGTNVRIHNDTIAVSSPRESSSDISITNGETASANNSALDSGAVYVYRNSDTGWKQEAYVKAANADIDDRIRYIALSSDRLVVCSTNEDSTDAGIINGTGTSGSNAGTSNGAVYVYKRTGTTWAQEAYIKPLEITDSMQFGTSLDLDGSTLVVGASSEDSDENAVVNGAYASSSIAASQSGAAYVYHHNGAAWEQIAFLKASNAETNDRFGQAVSVSGDTIAVTSYGEDNDQNSITNGPTVTESSTVADIGALYVFRNKGRLFEPSQPSYVSNIDGTIEITWGGNVGIGETFKVVYNTGSTAPADCNTGTLAYNGAGNTATISGLPAGQRIAARVCAIAGASISTGTTVQAVARDTTAPTVTSITAGSANPTNSTSVSYTVLFSEAVAGVSVANFAFEDVDGSGVTGNIASVTGSGASYTVTLDTLAGAGRFKINLSSLSGIYDLHYNALGTPYTGADVYSKVGWYQEAYIKTSNADAGDSLAVFSKRLALDGNLMAVGTIVEQSNQSFVTNGSTSSADNSLSSAGAVYLFERAGNDWQQVAYLKPNNIEGGDVFGVSVDISDSQVAVGASREDSSLTTIINGSGSGVDNSSTNSGAVYIFSKVASNWTQTAYIKASNRGGYDEFGNNLSISGNRLAVIAMGEDSEATIINNTGRNLPTDDLSGNSGAAYLYTYRNEVWSQTAYFKASNNDTNSVGDPYYGKDISLYGDTLAISDYLEDSDQRGVTNGPSSSSNNTRDNSGAVYIYRDSVNGWVQEAYVKASNSDQSDSFGREISLSGDFLAVSTSLEDSTVMSIVNTDGVASTNNLGASVGAVYVFKRSGSTWVQDAYLKGVIDHTDYLGGSVALAGDTIVAGATGEDSNETTITNSAYGAVDGGAAESGAVFVYERDSSGIWAQTAFVKSPNAEADDLFGNAVRISGDTFVVAARAEDSNERTISNGTTASSNNDAADSGAIYVFRNKGKLFDPHPVQGRNLTAGTIDLNWSPNTGTGTSFKVSYQTGQTAPATCDAGISAYTGTSTSTQLTGLTEGGWYAFRVCSVDDANSLSSEGVTYAVRVLDQTDPTIVSIDRVDTNPTTTDSVDYTVTFSEPVAGLDASAFGFVDVNTTGITGNIASVAGVGDTYTVTIDSIVGVGEFRLDLTDPSKTFDLFQNPVVNPFTSGETYVKKGWRQEAFFKPANYTLNLWLANNAGTVSLDKDTVAVGAFYEKSEQTTITTVAPTDSNLTDSGAVFVLKRTGNTWAQEAFIKAENSSSNDRLGWSVSLSGDKLAVGAPLEDSNATTIFNAGQGITVNDDTNDSGAAYVFSRSGNTWTRQAYIKAASNDIQTNFGSSVALHGDLLAVSAPNDDYSGSSIINSETVPADDDGASNSGAVYVYEWTGTSWKQSAYVKASNNTGQSDNFGTPVRIFGDTIVVGNLNDDSSSSSIINGATSSALNDLTNVGSVFVYRLGGLGWEQEAYIKAANAGNGDGFGKSIDIDGNYLAVSSTLEDSNGVAIINGTSTVTNDLVTNSGAVYMYKRTGTSWQQDAYIKGSNLVGSHFFGDEVSISGNLLAVSSSADQSTHSGIYNFNTPTANTGASNSGAVWVFERSGSGWQEISYLKPGDADVDDLFGKSLSLSGDTLAVAAPKDNANSKVITNGLTHPLDNDGDRSGALYLYRFEGGLLEPSSLGYSVLTEDSIRLSWANKLGIGVSVKIVGGVGSTAPADCTGTAIYQGTDETATVFGLSANTRYTYRVCSVDADGNYSAGKIISTRTTNVLPTVVSIDRAETSPSSDTTLDYLVTFSEAITGVSSSSFQVVDVNSTGITGTIGVSGSGNTRTVSVSITGSAGEFRLDLHDPTGITDSSSGELQAGFTSGESYVFIGWEPEAIIKAGNVSANDGFGSSLSAYGDTVVVGVIGEDNDDRAIINGTTSDSGEGANNAGAVYVYRKTSEIWAQEAYIKPSNLDAEDQFGEVDFSKNTIVVGAKFEDANINTITNNSSSASTDNLASQSGAVYVFDRTGTTWAQTAYIKHEGNGDFDHFGNSVGYSSETIVVGSRTERSNDVITNSNTTPGGSLLYNGSAFVFTKTGSAWGQVATLKASDRDSDDRLGQQVDISNDTVIACASGEDSNTTSIINGTTADSDDSFTDSGALYIFRRSNVWAQEAYVKIGNNQTNISICDVDSKSISIDGNTVVIGVRTDDSNLTTITNGTSSSTDTSAVDSGSVFVYRRSGALWAQEAYIKASNAVAGDKFGYSVSLSGNTLVVGSMETSTSTAVSNYGVADTGDFTNAGATYVFERSGTLWSHSAFIKPRDLHAGMRFGERVKAQGGLVVVGATSHAGSNGVIVNSATGLTGSTSGATDSGAVYIFRNKHKLFDPPKLELVASTGSSTLSWDKENAGTATSFYVDYSSGNTPPADCSSATDVGDVDNHVVNGLVSGVYSFRVCSYDGSTLSQGSVGSVYVP